MFGKMDFAQAMRDIRDYANGVCSAVPTYNMTTRREWACTPRWDRGKCAGASE
jgi:hypothetical protein